VIYTNIYILFYFHRKKKDKKTINIIMSVVLLLSFRQLLRDLKRHWRLRMILVRICFHLTFLKTLTIKRKSYPLIYPNSPFSFNLYKNFLNLSLRWQCSFYF